MNKLAPTQKLNDAATPLPAKVPPGREKTAAQLALQEKFRLIQQRGRARLRKLSLLGPLPASPAPPASQTPLPASPAATPVVPPPAPVATPIAVIKKIELYLPQPQGIGDAAEIRPNRRNLRGLHDLIPVGDGPGHLPAVAGEHDPIDAVVCRPITRRFRPCIDAAFRVGTAGWPAGEPPGTSGPTHDRHSRCGWCGSGCTFDSGERSPTRRYTER